ncbi:MAG TPA: ATP-binding cassette domain-containing protein [Conexibacter sp.]
MDCVSKSFWRGVRELRPLREVTLDVPAGQLVAVYGTRGAGKTTLLRIAAGLEAPDEGRVLLGGRDIARLDRREQAALRRRIGVVVRREPEIPDVPMLVHVAMPLYGQGKRAAHRQAAAALERCGVGDLADARWADLSDTSRTLVAIAHALAREPELIVVDDPTGGLSVIDRERVIGLLRDAAEHGGCGVLLATPELAGLSGHVDRVAMLSRGRLIAPEHHDAPDSVATVVEFPGGERSA